MAAPTTRPAAADRSVDVKKIDGSKAGSATLPGAVFGIEPNGAVMHQVVTAQRAAGRAGTHSTKTRAEVAGGGSKPWRQKGTGRSRQGSIRSPHWAGGGVAHGPRPRDYSQKTPKKMIRLALRSALSDRAASDHVAVVDTWSFDEPKTKAAKAALDALGVEPSQRALVVLAADDDLAWKSFRNLEGERRVHCIDESQLNAYEVLVADWVVFTEATLASVSARLQDRGRRNATEASSAEASPTEAADETGEES